MESTDPTPKPKLANNASSSSSSLPSPPERSNSQSSTHKPGHIASHRQSFAENQRHPPPSPRAQRHPSFTQQAIQDLLNHPPTNRHPNPRYAGRDWRDIALSELSIQDEVRWADLDTSIEEATMTLLKNNASKVVLVRQTATSKHAVSTFDCSDLNAYLLVVVGLAKPDEEYVELYDDIAKKAQAQTPITLREIQPICRKEDLVVLSAESTLDKAIETFGGGVHRLLITNQDSEVVGILSQLRLLEFFWHEAVNFPMIDRLYGVPLRELQIGTQQIIAINADAPLADALLLMNNEGLTSVAVVDNGLNVVGNISTADVRHLTSAASLPLLKSSCMHFISVILSERGVEHGRDSFPVFYVNPYSTLGHTVAKLVATNSHRMWVVESASPSPSAPATPLLQPTHPIPTPIGASAVGSGTGAASPGGPTVLVPPTGGASSSGPQSPSPGQGFNSVPAAAMPGAHLSGRLTGVVSLTDILNLFAKSSGLHPSDPSEQRARRRRSSSASVRPSLESGRASLESFRR
ncbi:protein SDS23 [Diplogelasinospora grovesii]|uniref:Protein SDS23 n=1 Tax=Diplogelasinospora grovesii TaxID=303347 RepID=A0AAN6N295_9PEZI|nr:protein SDS23 [Diplogelasinospora grovesii]